MTDHRAPLFTVVIPLFDKAAHIDATLTSIAAQTFDDFEIVVVDDGSTDGSVAIVEEWDDPRLLLITQDNAGPGVARNRGIAEASGEWIAFIDADDLWLPDHLATLVETMTAYPAADLVGTGFVRGVTSAAITPAEEGSPRPLNFFEEHQHICTSTVAVRTSELRNDGFGAAWPGEDVELWTRLALRHSFAVHSRRTAVYVQHTGGAMDSQSTTAAPVPISHQSLFKTIDAILQESEFADRHVAIQRFRNTLLLEYARPALFNGQTALATCYLRELRDNGGRPPFLYQLLSHIPGAILRPILHAYARAKRRWRNRKQ